ncbi:unnamed protein product [Peronospora belbahrii]|uniref:Uncharacterized protein n=1 Tax=Peronospora belbahrii TaxID=622444 RepID=A0AAU9LF98_9STRA|nr:unnamed protein product [Peronospora belbahrii]
MVFNQYSSRLLPGVGCCFDDSDILEPEWKQNLSGIGRIFVAGTTLIYMDERQEVDGRDSEVCALLDSLATKLALTRKHGTHFTSFGASLSSFREE